MSGKRIVFIPWDRSASDGSDVADMIDQWNNSDTANQKNFQVVCKGEKPAYFRSLSVSDVIYVVGGHGNVGASDFQGISGATIEYDEVCKRLIESGLQKGFSGKIKFYSCHSGEGVGATPAFGKRCHDYLKGKGFNSCWIFGYVGSVDQYYGNTPTNAPPALKDHKYSLVGGVDLRASTQRVRMS
jgi:hypothetical protein